MSGAGKLIDPVELVERLDEERPSPARTVSGRN